MDSLGCFYKTLEDIANISNLLDNNNTNIKMYDEGISKIKEHGHDSYIGLSTKIRNQQVNPDNVMRWFELENKEQLLQYLKMGQSVENNYLTNLRYTISKKIKHICSSEDLEKADKKSAIMGFLTPKYYLKEITNKKRRKVFFEKIKDNAFNEMKKFNIKKMLRGKKKLIGEDLVDAYTQKIKEGDKEAISVVLGLIRTANTENNSRKEWMTELNNEYVKEEKKKIKQTFSNTGIRDDDWVENDFLKAYLRQ